MFDTLLIANRGENSGAAAGSADLVVPSNLCKLLAPTRPAIAATESGRNPVAGSAGADGTAFRREARAGEPASTMKTIGPGWHAVCAQANAQGAAVTPVRSAPAAAARGHTRTGERSVRPCTDRCGARQVVT